MKGREVLPAAFALLLAAAFSPQQVHAGTLAQLQLQVRSAKHPAHMDLCVGGARTATCRAALDTALHSAARLMALKGRLPSEHGLYLSGKLAAVSDTSEALPLKFNTDPEWKKRAIVMAHEGLTFLRMPEGANHEFVVGINRHGMLGFSLKDTTGE